MITVTKFYEYGDTEFCEDAIRVVISDNSGKEIFSYDDSWAVVQSRAFVEGYRAALPDTQVTWVNVNEDRPDDYDEDEDE